MKYLIFLFLTTTLAAQGEFSSFISSLYGISDPAVKTAKIDSFYTYALTKGIPFIEGNTANFMYKGSKTTVQIAGDFTDWSPAVTMSRIPATNFFYFSRTFEMNARLDYKIVADGTWILDPANPKKVYGGFGPNSELAMPEYVQPWEVIYKSSIPHGTVKTRSVSSTNTGSVYDVSIYFPPGYDSSASVKYPSVYFQDGSEYINLGSAVIAIDNLLNRNIITPVIAVFVKPTNREVEYATYKRDQYRMFFVNELVPLIDSLCLTEKLPSKRMVLGDSWGGNISALIAYNHADLFGNCGLHSGAFWPNNYEAYQLILSGPKKDIRFTATWGTYESLFSNMRDFRDSLLAKGYPIKWKEVPEGHSWGQWRANIDFLLEDFVPGTNAYVEDNSADQEMDYNLMQNYPNPFNPVTNISFKIRSGSFVSLKVFNGLGKEIAELVNSYLNAGSYIFNFNGASMSSGVYFYRLEYGNGSETRKMLLLK